MIVPVYTQIVKTIKEKINSGELRPGDIIDSENALSREFGASRVTVRKGLAILVNEGYIYSIYGGSANTLWRREQRVKAFLQMFGSKLKGCITGFD